MPSLLADPRSASDIVAFSIGLIALTQAGVWYRQREPGMLWFAAGSFLSTCLVVANGAVWQPGVAPGAGELLTMYAVRGLFAFGLTAYFRITRRTRAIAIAALVLPAAVIALAILAGEQATGRATVLPLLWADLGMTVLCLIGARREPGAGHEVLAIAPLIGPCAALLAPLRGPGPHLNHDFPGAAIGFGVVVLVVSLMRKSRDSRLAQAHAQRMSDYYAALSRTNQALLRTRNPVALYQEICRICVESAQAKMACVYEADAIDHFAHRVASFSRAGEELEGYPDPWDMTSAEGQKSYMVRAILDGRRLVSNDYQNDPLAAPWLHLARQHEVRAIAFLPLRRASRTVATLMVAAGEAGIFDDALVRLLDEMTEDISFALDNIDREARHIESVRQVEAGLARFERLFQTAPIAAAIISIEDRRVVDVNDAICALHRTGRENLIGRTTDELSLRSIPEDRLRFYEALRNEGRIRNLVMRMRSDDGRSRVVLTNAEPIDYLGKPCVIFMSLDITDMHAAEEARQALMEAQAASNAKTRFLSSMSHELRTPLNAVLGFSSLLRHEAADRLSQRQVEQLDHVQQAGWHLLRLINDVLDLSRIEAGQFGVDVRAVELAPLLDEAIQMSQPQAGAEHVTLVSGYRDAAPAWALADPTRLRQAVLNLLSNAIKYNRVDGTVRVSVSQQDGRASIAVADTGLGMNAQQLAHLFEPFNRLGREREGFEGTGIGLALTRQLMQLMNGDVTVTSEEGRGTRIVLTLPAVEGAPASMGATSATAVPDGTSPRGTVLYIEDNPVNTLLVEQLLARWPDVRFVAAMDGATGLQMAISLRPTLVLLDLQLPDLDGLDVLTRLRAHAALRDTPVVVLSASAMTDEIAEARSRGAADYWTKPLDFAQFLAGVADRLRRAGEAPA